MLLEFYLKCPLDGRCVMIRFVTENRFQRWSIEKYKFAAPLSGQEGYGFDDA